MPNEQVYNWLGGQGTLNDRLYSLSGNAVSCVTDPVTGVVALSGFPNGTNRYTPYILAQNAVPIGIPHSGTMAANGAVTFGSAFDATYSDGIWLYYPAGAVAAGSTAGFYWTVMSTTDIGAVFTAAGGGPGYTPGTNLPTIPASPVAVVDAGPGAFAGATAEITVASWTIPAGALGISGGHRTTHLTGYINNANNKARILKFNGNSIGASGGATTSRGVSFLNTFRNRGRVDRQVALPYGSDSTTGNPVTGTGALTSVDTSAATTVTISLIHSIAATDWIVLESYCAEILPS